MFISNLYKWINKAITWQKILLEFVKPDDSLCDVADLEPAQVVQCTDKNGIPVITSTVSSGSSCDILCPYEKVKAWVMCDEGEWNDYYHSCK